MVTLAVLPAAGSGLYKHFEQDFVGTAWGVTASVCLRSECGQQTLSFPFSECPESESAF